MAKHRDKPPVFRALVLLVALVSTALALASLSPPQPEPAAAAQPGKTSPPSAATQP